MNVEHANTISLPEILGNLGFSPIGQEGQFCLYPSPFDNTPGKTIKINAAANQWLMDEDKEPGHTIDFVCAYLRGQGVSHSIDDALRYLKNTIGYVRIKQVDVPDYTAQDKPLKPLKAKAITSASLVGYLQQRNIPLPLAEKYLREVTVQNTANNKKFIALGLKSEEGGYAIRNPFVKANIGRTGISFIRGKIPKPPGIHIFDDAMDFLSILEHGNDRHFHDDAIILNSLSYMDEATAYIRNYGYEKAYTWLDNDKAGREASKSFDEFFKTQDSLIYFQMNRVYRGFKDANAWYCAKNSPAMPVA